MGIPTGDEVSANDYDLEQYQKLKVIISINIRKGLKNMMNF
jgi:hypothetical protein